MVALRQHNLSLEARILDLENQLSLASSVKEPISFAQNISFSTDSSGSAPITIPATVFMSYPFNDKHRLTLDQGSLAGVTVGSLVVVSDTLIGQVVKVYKDYSVFKTIFDPSWEFPVYIGNNQIRGLFIGGIEPKVTLISKKETISDGDLIITADPNIVSSKKIIGRITSVAAKDSSSFFEAVVAIPYNLNNIRQVIIKPKL